MRPLVEGLMRLHLDGFMTHVGIVFRVYTTLDECIYFAVGVNILDSLICLEVFYYFVG